MSNLEVVVESRVVITSPFHMMTRSNKLKLLSIIRSIRTTYLRFSYVMKAFPGSTLELVEVGVVDIACMHSPARSFRAQGSRENTRVIVLCKTTSPPTRKPGIMGRHYKPHHPLQAQL